MEKIWISGCAGFVGSNLVKHLLQAGYKVGGCDSLQFGYADNLPKDFKFTAKPMHECLYEAMGYDILVHCATANIIYAQDKPLDTHLINNIDTVEFFNIFKRKIIYTSTSSVYGNADQLPTPEDAPKKMTNAYARSKYCAELFLQDRGNYTTLRLTNTYGSKQRPDHAYSGVLGKVLGAMLNETEIEIYGDGNQTRDFIYVDDVCMAIIKAIELPALNTEINIGTGVETSVNELIKIASEINYRSFTTRNVKPREIDTVDRRCLDISKAKQLLGWHPKTSLSEGIKNTTKWVMANYKH